MPDAVQTLAGTTIGVSATLPGTYDSTGFAALTFTDIGEVVDMPEFGVSYNPVTHLAIAGRQIKKYKGSYDNGNLTLTMARDDDDAGQVIALAALASDADYAFEITYQDATIDYFQGKCMSFVSVGGGADSIVNRVMQIALTEDVVTA